MPPSAASTYCVYEFEHVDTLYQFGCVTTMDIAQLIYRPPVLQGKAKDYEFSRRIMEERWAQGLSDATATLASSPWLEPMPYEVGVRTFDVLRPKTELP